VAEAPEPMGAKMTDDLRAYTLPEAAERLDVSVRTLQRMAARGELRLISLGSAKRVPASELARLLAPARGLVDVFQQGKPGKRKLYPRVSA
jgi:excisionase family DNA binding protein